MKRFAHYLWGFLLVVCLGGPALADSNTQAVAREVVREINTLYDPLGEDNIKGVVEKMSPAMTGPLEGQLRAAGLPDVNISAISTGVRAIAADMIRDWAEKNRAAVMEFTADTYARTFSVEELRALQVFYRSGPGRRILTKMPSVTNQTAAFVGKQLQEFLPQMAVAMRTRIRPLVDEQVREAQKAGWKPPAAAPVQ